MSRATRSIMALALALVGFGARAEDFYKGKQVQLLVGHEPGNDYDIGARLLAKYLPKHIPGGPTIVVQNMPQAAGLATANHLYVRAARDGTVMGSISRNLPSQALMGLPNIEADPRRYNWLGATSFPGRVCAAAADAPVQSMADIFSRELITGGVGVGSSTSIVPTVLNKVLGTKFKIVEGYRGAGSILLAIERGEVHGVCMSLGQFRSHEDRFRDGKMRFLFRAEEAPLPSLPDVPTIYDRAKTSEQRQLLRFVFSSTEFGRPYLMPPDVPKDRVALMRQAIADAARDPELIAEAGRMKLDMTYRPPDHLERLLASLYDTPPAVIDDIKKVVPNLR